MAKSDARFEYRAKLGRTDHNLSQPFGFTTTCGMLLPIWYDIATPGDSYYMQHDLPLLRSIQLLAPSMVDVKVHYETFFVPMQMIYQPFENTVFSLRNLQSSLYPNDLINTNFPLLDFSGLLEDVVSDTTSLHADAYRLLDLFGLCPRNASAGLGITAYTPNFFPYQICAYNTIYNYYYRLDDKSNFSNHNCNVDQYYDATVFALLPSCLQIHQRPWDFDYFMSMYRSPIVSNANMQRVLPSLSSDLVNNNTAGIREDGQVNSIYPNQLIRAFSSDAGAAVTIESLPLNISTASIRQMFANEKLAMITGRTRKNYDSQVLAHFGVDVPHDVKHDITMIHHDEYDLHVQEVTSLASTDDAPLGELAGKSYSAGDGKQFKFTAPCHGVIMTIFSIEPKKRYVTSFDRINAITNAYDLPTPEFDRLGNVPMYRYECGYRQEVGSRSNTDIIGWKERYYQFKRKPARVTTAFVSENGVNNYGSYFLNCFPFGEATIGRASGTAGISTLGDPRPDLESRFYIERGALDSMCALPFYDGWKAEEDGENWNITPWLIYSRDPFIVNSHIKCKKVSWMSKDGEPIYNF